MWICKILVANKIQDFVQVWFIFMNEPSIEKQTKFEHKIASPTKLQICRCDFLSFTWKYSWWFVVMINCDIFKMAEFNFECLSVMTYFVFSFKSLNIMNKTKLPFLQYQNLHFPKFLILNVKTVIDHLIFYSPIPHISPSAFKLTLQAILCFLTNITNKCNYHHCFCRFCEAKGTVVAVTSGA